LPRGHDAWHNIERNQPFFGIVVTIDRKGNAGTAKEFFGIARLLLQMRAVLFGEPFMIGRVLTPCLHKKSAENKRLCTCTICGQRRDLKVDCHALEFPVAIAHRVKPSGIGLWLAADLLRFRHRRAFRQIIWRFDVSWTLAHWHTP
jgi:hypothetical protein